MYLIESCSRFFSKRAKTDLGFDGLAAYKASKKPPGGTKYPAPKVRFIGILNTA